MYPLHYHNPSPPHPTPIPPHPKIKTKQKKLQRTARTKEETARDRESRLRGIGLRSFWQLNHNEELHNMNGCDDASLSVWNSGQKASDSIPIGIMRHLSALVGCNPDLGVLWSQWWGWDTQSSFIHSKKLNAKRVVLITWPTNSAGAGASRSWL